MKEQLRQHIERSIEAKQKILADDAFIELIAEAAEICTEALQDGQKILFAGNGGSAADAQHIAAELIGRYKNDRLALPAVALTTDTSALTAIGNDYGYDEVFARQLSGLAQEGDVFVAISTSGNSGNIIKACDVAKEKGVKIIGLSGQKGKLMELSDVALCVPAEETAAIQESHIMLGHMICVGIEEKLF